MFMLTDLERAILTFEDSWPRHTGNKEAEIRDRFGMSSARYYQIIHGLAVVPDAVALFPMLANRRARRGYM